MKKFSVFLICAIMIFTFNGCHDIDEEIFIFYNNKYYEAFTNNDDWYPLSTADITDTAYLCWENENASNLSDKDKTEIKKFSDKSLDMFIVDHSTFWGKDYLYCDIEYTLPDLSNGKVEEIVVESISDDEDDVDDLINYHNSDNYVVIDNKNDVNQISNDIIYIEKNSNDIKSYQIKEVQDFAQLYVKFENINALYYIGILGLSDNGELVFYNAHHEESLYYLLYDNNSTNPFSIVLG